MNKLKGKKTYILAGCGAIVWVAMQLGWVPLEIAQQLWVLLGFGSAAALRNGIS